MKRIEKRAKGYGKGKGLGSSKNPMNDYRPTSASSKPRPTRRRSTGGNKARDRKGQL